MHHLQTKNTIRCIHCSLKMNQIRYILAYIHASGMYVSMFISKVHRNHKHSMLRPQQIPAVKRDLCTQKYQPYIYSNLLRNYLICNQALHWLAVQKAKSRTSRGAHNQLTGERSAAVFKGSLPYIRLDVLYICIYICIYSSCWPLRVNIVCKLKHQAKHINP